eukprot:Pompholyxophrys_punicea_v1_NODE_69_length_3835_cov_3.436772.p1 type:complete len:299 gc:universal NODE_69_length_3835_cov_3.436772:654-1550(+)
MLASSPILVHYDKDLPLVLTVDASGVALGVVLSHEVDGKLRPIAYSSRTLTPAEVNYSQIEKEGLAIVFGVRKFHSFLFGRKFVLETDHKPLVAIFGEHKQVPAMIASRLQRWAIILAGYNYEIRYVASKDNAADWLSRLPLPDQSDSEAIDRSFSFLWLNENKVLTAKDIQIESRRDPNIAKLLECLQSNRNFPQDSPDWMAFSRRRPELSVEEGCVLWNSRVIIPEIFRRKVLDELHSGHFGVSKMKSLARMIVWWPGIDQDVEELFLMCNSKERASKECVVSLDTNFSPMAEGAR